MINKTFYKNTRKLYEEGYGKRIVNTLISFAASDIGYRLGGTPQEHEASAFIAAELKEAGLSNVKMEQIPVDSFELKGAKVTVEGAKFVDGKAIPARELVASQFAGFRGTPEGGITGQVVYVGSGLKEDYEAISKDKDYFKDKIVLIDARFDTVWIGWQSSEATVFGAKAAIMTCTDEIQGTYLKYAPDMLIGGDGENNYEDIPTIFISKQDGNWLKEKLSQQPDVPVTVESNVNVTLAKDGGHGYNVVAEIPGKNKGKRIIVDSHIDAHLKAAADDTGAVATAMTLAKAMAMSGYEPESTIQFMFTSAEEYGMIDTIYDWQHGAVQALVGEHKDWADGSTLVLGMEVMPEKGGELLFKSTHEVMAPLEKCIENMKGDNYPTSITAIPFIMSIANDWSYYASGIPGACATYMREDYLGRYHTNYDKEIHMDYEDMSRIANAFFDIIQEFDTGLIDYSIDMRAGDLNAWYNDPAVSTVENEILVGLSKEEFNKIDVDGAAVENMDKALADWTASIDKFNGCKADIKDIDAANIKLMQYNKLILSSFIASTVGQQIAYPYQQTLADAVGLKAALDAAAAKDKDAVLEALDRVNLCYTGWIPLTQFIKWFTIDTCKRMSKLYEEKPNTWGSLSKLSPICCVYDEYVEVRDKDEPDYDKVYASLEKTYNDTVVELNKRLNGMADTMNGAAAIMAELAAMA